MYARRTLLCMFHLRYEAHDQKTNISLHGKKSLKGDDIEIFGL